MDRYIGTTTVVVFRATAVDDNFLVKWYRGKSKAR